MACNQQSLDASATTYPPDKPRVVGGEAEPAGWRDEQSNETKLDRGTSATELARELNVSAQKIYWWRRRLSADERTTEPRFMEVRVAAQPQANPFAVQRSNGRTVAVWPGFDADELQRLLATVECVEC
jgi:hypothetical protein